MPLWDDKGDFFDIGDWIDYCQRYEFVLSLSITEWFDVSIETSNKWIEERTVSKTFLENIKKYDHKYRDIPDIAEKMFP